jgi:chemotaxis protein histidine kinase CheA
MNDRDCSNADPVLLELFRAELDAHLPVLSDGLLALEKGRAGEPEIAAMMRAAHSIKGAARIVGIEAAVRVAHVLEDCFTAAKDQRITLSSEAVDDLLQGVDALQRICGGQPDPELTETWLESVLERIAAVRDGRVRTVAAASPPPSEPAVTAPPRVQVPPTEARRVVLPADFDDAAVEGVRRELCAALSHGTPVIRLDFTLVRRMSAGALALLSALARDLARTEPAPALVAEGVVGRVAALVHVAGLDRAWTAGA